MKQGFLLLSFFLFGLSGMFEFVSEAHAIKVGVITDIAKCPTKSSGKVSEATLNKFIKDVNSKETDFNVDLGDNVSYRVADCSHSAVESFHWVLDRLKKTNSKIYHVLSDHDINSAETFKQWLSKTGLSRTYYSFDMADVHVVVLDTITGTGTFPVGRDKKTMLLEWDRGQVSTNQLNWLKDDLKKTTKGKVLIFSDHPLFVVKTSLKTYNITNREALTKILKESGKNVVSIAGEIHDWKEKKENGIQYYVVRKFHDGGTDNWAIFEWTAKGYTFKKVEK